MTLGEFILHRIRVLGIDQTALANRVGKSGTWVHRLIHSRESLPDRADLDALADALECSRPELLWAAGYLDTPDSWGLGECATFYAWLKAIERVEDIEADEREFVASVVEDAHVRVQALRRSQRNGA